jgi:hypothetical protein
LICVSSLAYAFLRIVVVSIKAVFHPSATCSTSRALACAIPRSAKDLTISTYALSATSDERANNLTLSSTSRPMSVDWLLGGAVVVLLVDFRVAIASLLRIKSMPFRSAETDRGSARYGHAQLPQFYTRGCKSVYRALATRFRACVHLSILTERASM